MKPPSWKFRCKGNYYFCMLCNILKIFEKKLHYLVIIVIIKGIKKQILSP
jgi:hypothetical protein